MAFRIGVDLDRRRLARTHLVELRLLEVRGDPDVVRDEHGEAGAGGRVLADRPRKVDDAPGLGGRDGRVGEIEFSLVALGVRLREVRVRGAALRLQDIDLPLRRAERCLRGLQRRFLLAQLRAVLLGVLHGAPAGLGQVLVARRLLLREHQAGLRLLDLGLAWPTCACCTAICASMFPMLSCAAATCASACASATR